MSRNLVRASTGLALLACGVTGLLTLTACSSSSPTPAAGPSTPGAASPSNSQPSWASALGTGVAVVAPRAASPGHGSPGAVVTGLIAALNSKKFRRTCGYTEPGLQAECKASQMPASQMPFAANFALGYMAIDGDKAAVGMTGKFCTPGHLPECFTNHDPAAIFSSAKSFRALWKNAIKNTPDYSLTPCIKIGGKWYIYASA